VQRPSKQVAIPQLVPQAPQFAALVWVSTQASPQAVSPAGHTRRHAPATQLCPALQVVPQAPQWAGLVCASTHAAAQAVRPVGHTRRHAPSTQLWPAAQGLPQAPQCWVSTCVSRHRPSQSVRPAAQRHAPLVHDCSGAHIVAQAPQLVSSDSSVAQAAPHTVWPVGHESWQTPSEHTRPAEQGMPQPPQCAGSLWVSRHTPLQSDWPDGHAHAPPAQT